MKKWILCLKPACIGLILLLRSPVFCQSKCNPALIMRLNDNNTGSDLVYVLVKGNVKELKARQDALHVKLRYSAGDIASVVVLYRDLKPLLASRLVSWVEYQPVEKSVGGFLGDSTTKLNRLQGIRNGSNPLKKSFTGSGVLIGIIDSGVDLTHPDLRDELGRTRIRYLWDQSVEQDGNDLRALDYGREWDARDINAGLCTHKDKTGTGHGTFVAGLAAGNGRATGYWQGCAPNADLLMVALDPGQPAPVIADAVRYILNKADELGRPVVINLSYGSYIGSHDATDLETKLVEAMIANVPGRSLVSAAGNAGGSAFHIKYKKNKGFASAWIKRTERETELSLYGDSAKISKLQIAIGMSRLSYQDMGQTTFHPYAYARHSVKTDTVFYQGHPMGLVRYSASINAYGVCQLYLKLVSDSASFLWRIDARGKGEFDAWNFDLAPAPSGFPEYEVLTPDPYSSLADGLQCSEEVVTVGSYANKISCMLNDGSYYVSGDAVGQVSGTSSLGPARHGGVKPDILATGENMVSSMDFSIQGKKNSVGEDLILVEGFHGLGSGTSFAAAVVTGWVALYLELYPQATNRDIKSAIIRSAYKDKNIGKRLPDLKCGYGKLDGYQSFFHK